MFDYKMDNFNVVALSAKRNKTAGEKNSQRHHLSKLSGAAFYFFLPPLSLTWSPMAIPGLML